MSNRIIRNRIGEALSLAQVEFDAETIAIASALDLVNEYIKNEYSLEDKLAINLFGYYDGDRLAVAFYGLIFDFIEDGIVVRNYDIDTIGKIVAGWVLISENIFLDGNGYSWDDMDESWQRLDDLNLRWTMIESR